MRQRVYGHISSLDCRLCGHHEETLDHLLSPGKCCMTHEAIRVVPIVDPNIANIDKLTVIRTCRQAESSVWGP